MPDGYSYKIEQCDVPVERRSALERFRAKRRVWSSWLATDEHHAIWSTLYSMVWANVAFTALRDLAVSNDESALNNSLLFEALLPGHLATQILGIRRLMDTGGSGVISLRRLVRDVAGCFELFTREHFVCFDGLPYDYQAIRDARFATMRRACARPVAATSSAGSGPTSARCSNMFPPTSSASCTYGRR